MGRLAKAAGAVDTPTEERRMHQLATPLLGGLGMYLAWLTAVLMLVPISRPVWGIIAGVSIVVAVGLFDDLFELEPIIKFIGQLLAIAVAMYFGVRVNRVAVPFATEFLEFPGLLSVLVTTVWMAAIINMVNFIDVIDGLDGLAAGVCGISAVTFTIISISTGFGALGILAAVLAGCTFAFLRFNFHPASIFMGDAGSMLLGFVLGAISVQSVMKGTAAVALVLPLLVLGVPFIDLFLIVWRRWRRRVPFYSAGADHVHHDLVLVHGFSQRKSVLLLYSWCLSLNVLAVAMQQDWGWVTIALGALAAVSTAYMARLLSRYRSRHIVGPETPVMVAAEALETGEVLELPGPAKRDPSIVPPVDLPPAGRPPAEMPPAGLAVADTPSVGPVDLPPGQPDDQGTAIGPERV